MQSSPYLQNYRGKALFLSARAVNGERLSHLSFAAGAVPVPRPEFEACHIIKAIRSSRSYVFENFPRLKSCTGTVSTNAKASHSCPSLGTTIVPTQVHLPDWFTRERHWTMCSQTDRFPGRSHLNIYEHVRTTKVPSVLSCRSGNCPVHGQLRWKNGRRTQRCWTFEEFLGPVIGSEGRSIPTSGTLSRASSVPSDPIKHSKAVLPSNRTNQPAAFASAGLSSGALPSVRTIRVPKDQRIDGTSAVWVFSPMKACFTCYPRVHCDTDTCVRGGRLWLMTSSPS
jgi:hypothetical protein